MAERLDEIEDDFWGVRITDNLDPHLLQSASIPPSDQVEANTGAGNEDPAESVPKEMTPISCLNEICVVRKLSVPQYESMGEVGVAHMKIFTMEVWVRDMDLREIGQGKTKMEAKHEAATRVLDKLRAAGERNEGLHQLTPEDVEKCHDMLKKFVLVEPKKEAESESTRFSAGELRAYEMAHEMTPSVFDCVDVSGPPHNRIFTMTCKQGEHVTRGTGKSKQIGKNIAASHMMKILSESSPENPPQQLNSDRECDDVSLQVPNEM